MPASSSFGYRGAESAENAVACDVVDRVQAVIYEVAERSMIEDYVALE
ncbi:hypothetical protein ACQPWY_27595 [Pseudonocardia xinjiangensis]